MKEESKYLKDNISDVKIPIINNMENKNGNNKIRYIIIILSSIQIFLSSGIILGWPSLANMIKSENIFKFSREDPAIPSLTEEVYLAKMMNLSLSRQMFSTIFLGFLIDYFGPKFIGICQLITTIGTTLILIPKRDYVTINFFCTGIILQNLCGCIYIPSFIHMSNLFPSNKAMIISTLSTLYGFSSCVFLIMQFLYDYFSIRFNYLIGTLALLQGLFIIFSFMLPSETFEEGDDCDFSLIKGGFYKIKKNIIINNEINDSFMSKLKLLITNTKILINNIFSKLFLFQFMLGVFTLISVNFYLSTISLQIEELSHLPKGELRHNQGYFWSTILTFIAPFGSLIGVYQGYLIDKYGLALSSFVPCILLISCSLLKLIPYIPIQILTFVTYTTSQEAIFGTIYSLIAFNIPSNIICKFSSINLLLQSYPGEYFPNLLVSLFSENKWTFFQINLLLVFPTFIITILFITYLYCREENKIIQNQIYERVDLV
ncbi:uncharacterized protein CMU_015570 [Cryptosporidium muris RN66]|uniref:Major facilitator superfamily protein n=1 Tax=Cryptosporidium muris (strain RN66) TaxID=441375 RepID=B6ACF6_CRYMR|nr:uncharacterized protein CMU_015570 [Cryptosporidium muris RN66]EEA05810.1 hypothetical protein, conserved [Cryptosporidium muris RN66]|eukprot:XP_002140159.1 hypothetical protein [Cryptosporidium muris RN66]